MWAVRDRLLQSTVLLYGIRLSLRQTARNKSPLKQLIFTSSLSLLLLIFNSVQASEVEGVTNRLSEYVHPLLDDCEGEYNIRGLSLEDALAEIRRAIEVQLKDNESSEEEYREFEDHIGRNLFGRDLWDIDIVQGGHIFNKKDTHLRHPTESLIGPGWQFEGIEREDGDTVRLVYRTGSAGTSAMYSEYRFVRYNFVKREFLGDYIYAEIYEGVQQSCLSHVHFKVSSEVTSYGKDGEVVGSFLPELLKDSCCFFSFTLMEETPTFRVNFLGDVEGEHKGDTSYSTDIQSIRAKSSSGSGNPEPIVRNPNGVAVIIGNKTYTHERVPKVRYAHRDADAFRRYVLDVLGFDPENVIDYRDADKATMEAAFGNERSHKGHIWQRLNPGESSDVVVFYSGHGVPGINDGGAYLLPANADPNTAEINGYPIDLLYRNLAELADARSVRVFLDACFSGDSGGGNLVESASPVFATAALPNTGEKLTVLTAASGAEVASWDEETRHGLFTHHLLDALYGRGDLDGDGSVTAVEAKAYLDKEMTTAARRSFGRVQRASLSGEGTTILAASISGEGIPQRPILDGIGDRAGAGAGVEDKRDAGSGGMPFMPASWESDADSSASTIKQVEHLLEDVTLDDWALLAEHRLASGDYSRLVTEAKAFARSFGRDPRILSVAEQAVAGLARDSATMIEADPWGGLPQVHSIMRFAGEWPSLIRLEARAHELTDNLVREEEAHTRWLRITAPNHPDRLEVLAALLRVRTWISAAREEDALELNEEQQELVVHGLVAQGVDARLVSDTDSRGVVLLRANRDRAVLRAWQEEQGWEPTGYLTFEQCYTLIEAGHKRRSEQRG